MSVSERYKMLVYSVLGYMHGRERIPEEVPDQVKRFARIGGLAAETIAKLGDFLDKLPVQKEPGREAGTTITT